MSVRRRKQLKIKLKKIISPAFSTVSTHFSTTQKPTIPRVENPAYFKISKPKTPLFFLPFSPVENLVHTMRTSGEKGTDLTLFSPVFNNRSRQNYPHLARFRRHFCKKIAFSLPFFVAWERHLGFPHFVLCSMVWLSTGKKGKRRGKILVV